MCMTAGQIYVLAVLAATLGLFIWGRLRYDIVALLSLLAVVVGGIVPANQAFQGFAHPAVITVVAVLVISRALQNSGIIGGLARWVERINVGPSAQVAAVSLLVAVLSGFMNNVGALALLLPVVRQIAKRSGRSPGELLMPLAFGSLLGGLTTMVGTPPNIIVASFRVQAAGSPFSMFDFTPVGLLIAVGGIAFIAFYGWKLIPVRDTEGADGSNLDLRNYLTEVMVPPKSGLSLTAIEKLLETAEETEVGVVALIRRGRKHLRPDLGETLRINDHLLLHGNSEAIENLLHNTPLRLVGNRDLDTEASDQFDSGAMEVVVKPGSRLIRRSIAQSQLEQRHGVHLLALARQGRPVQETLRKIRIRAGDVLLVQGDMNTLPETLVVIGCLPLMKRDMALHREPTLIPLLIFSAAIILGVSGLLSLPVAFTGAVLGMVLCRQIPVRELYLGVDWPIVILLGAMVPVGLAMDVSGANDLLAGNIAMLADFLPPWGIVLLVLVTAMVLSDIINNAATAILMSQLSIQVADRLDVSADPLLMAVAIGSSCAFLTPIGHQSNILVMGPGGYRFGDYWRLGLPLEVVIVFVAVPMILWVWPL